MIFVEEEYLLQLSFFLLTLRAHSTLIILHLDEDVRKFLNNDLMDFRLGSGIVVVEVLRVILFGLEFSLVFFFPLPFLLLLLFLLENNYFLILVLLLKSEDSLWSITLLQFFTLLLVRLLCKILLETERVLKTRIDPQLPKEQVNQYGTIRCQCKDQNPVDLNVEEGIVSYDQEHQPLDSHEENREVGESLRVVE